MGRKAFDCSTCATITRPGLQRGPGHEAFGTSTYVGRVEMGADDLALFDAIFMGGGRAAAIVHVNPIFKDVDKALGIERE